MNTILSWFGKGDLAKAKKELADKDEEIAGLKKRIKELQAEKARLQERHKSEIGKLRDDYQKEIDAAIRKVEAADRQSKEKDAVIDKQRKQIDQLDRKANTSVTASRPVQNLSASTCPTTGIRCSTSGHGSERNFSRTPNSR